jgi:hypothetical protein
MDLNAIKSKLDKIQSKQQKFEKKDYSLTQWKPSAGKYTVRIVPSVYDSKNPFTELKFYYDFNPKVILSPLSYGEKDPIALLASKLREVYSAENYSLAKQISPKTRIFVPVIVRGEEEKGVRLWSFGKTIYEELLSMAADEEIGDYTDIVNGRDFKVEVVGKETTGTEYGKTNLRLAMKTSPLGTKEQINKWLKEQPKPSDEFKHFSFEELKVILEKFLNPEEIIPDDDSYVTDFSSNNTQPEVKNTKKFELDVSKSNKSKESKFENLFSEEDEVSNNIEEDDLPF